MELKFHPQPSPSELYMVQDSSVDYQDTWDFLNRRLEDTVTFSHTRQQVIISGGRLYWWSVTASSLLQLEEYFYSGVELLSAGLTTVCGTYWCYSNGCLMHNL